MHDSIIAQSILRDLAKYKDVKSVNLEIGELFGIEPNHLIEHLKDVSKINFNVHQSKSKVNCPKCDYEGRAKIVERFHDFVLYECPTCEGEVDVILGDKIVIKEIER